MLIIMLIKREREVMLTFPCKNESLGQMAQRSKVMLICLLRRTLRAGGSSGVFAFATCCCSGGARAACVAALDELQGSEWHAGGAVSKTQHHKP